MTQHELGRAPGDRDEADKLRRSAEAQADATRRAAGSVAEEVRGAGEDVLGEARRAGAAMRDETEGLVGSVRQQLVSHAQAQKDSLADRLAVVARQVHGTAEGMRDREAWLADLVDRGAVEIDGLADELRRRDVRSLMGGVETLASRHPAVFVGTAVAMGFALSRMMRGAAEPAARGYGGGYAHDDARGGEPAGARIYGRAGPVAEQRMPYTDAAGRTYGGMTTSGQMPGGQMPAGRPATSGGIREGGM